MKLGSDEIRSNFNLQFDHHTFCNHGSYGHGILSSSQSFADTYGQGIVLNGLGERREYHFERAPPKSVISKRLEYLEKFESHVEKYDRYQSLEMYKKSCLAVAKDRFQDFYWLMIRPIKMKTILSLSTQILKISVSLQFEGFTWFGYRSFVGKRFSWH